MEKRIIQRVRGEIMYQCEICGANVMALFGPGKNMVVLCGVCMDESRKIDGTLKSAFDKVMKIRGG